MAKVFGQVPEIWQAFQQGKSALKTIGDYCESPVNTQTPEGLKSKLALIQVIATETLEEMKQAEAASETPEPATG